MVFTSIGCIVNLGGANAPFAALTGAFHFSFSSSFSSSPLFFNFLSNIIPSPPLAPLAPSFFSSSFFFSSFFSSPSFFSSLSSFFFSSFLSFLSSSFFSSSFLPPSLPLAPLESLSGPLTPNIFSNSLTFSCIFINLLLARPDAPELPELPLSSLPDAPLSLPDAPLESPGNPVNFNNDFAISRNAFASSLSSLPSFSSPVVESAVANLRAISINALLSFLSTLPICFAIFSIAFESSNGCSSPGVCGSALPLPPLAPQLPLPSSSGPDAPDSDPLAPLEPLLP